METKLRGSKKSRLGRLNAIKNIDYEPASSGPSSPIYLGTQTSFRIEGIDGEIDRICWSLGLSGPDDFAIPSDVWEARKSKSTPSILHQEEDQIQHTDDPLVPTTCRAIGEDDQVPNSPTSTSGDITISEDDDQNPNSDAQQQQDANSRQQSTRFLQEEEEIQHTLLPSPTSSSRTITISEEEDQIPNSDAQQQQDATPRVSDTGGGGINGFTPPSLHIPLDNEQEDSPISSDKVDGLGLGETTRTTESSCSSNDSSHDDDESDDETTNTLPAPVYIISPNVSFKRNIKSWTKGALLGSGSFGTVYEGLSEDGFFFAVKEVSLLDQGNQAKQSILQLEQEISLLSQFEHENIVQYLGTDKDEEKLYIFLELVTKGSLAQLYQKYHLHDSQVSAYTRQILHGLMYLHDRNVVHRDIKCANILVDTKGYVKLADFGLAKATKFNDVKSCKGTAFWMAPEVVNRRSRGYGLAADIWSLGCTVLEMLTRQLPYSHLECMQALFRIGRGEPPPVSNSLSTTARDFIHRCLQVNADDRPTAALLLEHPFVNRPLSASSGPGSPSQPNWRRS